MGEGTGQLTTEPQARADQIKEEIEATRQDISRDVEALTYKASPSRVVHDRLSRVSSGVAGLRERVMGSNSDSDGPSVKDRVSDTASGVSGKASEVTDQVSGHVSDAASGISSAASTARVQVRERAEGNPLAAGVIAFGLGWLVSSMVPASSAETRAAARATDLAKEHGQPLAEKARESAREVGQQLREELAPKAQEAAEAVRSKTQTATATVTDETRSAAQDVKGEVQSGHADTSTGQTYEPTPAPTPAYQTGENPSSAWSLDERR